MRNLLPEAKHLFIFQRLVLAIQLAMIGVMSILILSRGKLPGWDMAVLLLFTVILWMLRGRIPFLDFSPFLLMLCTYEVIRSVILAVGTDGVHVTELIEWERALCAGIIPSVSLQQALSTTGYTWMVDLVANGFYMTHFFSVIIVGILLWINRKTQYWIYIVGLIVLSYSGFLTYVFYPAAPPWWASMNGYLLDQKVDLSHSLLSPEYIYATANPLGAIPSLHTAWPFYLFLYSVYIWGRKALPVVILPIGVAVSSIYLGHHYLVDILVGIGYAAIVFGLVVWWSKSRFRVREPADSLAAA